MAKPAYRQTYKNNATTTIVGALATGATACTVVDGTVFGSGLSTTFLIKATITDGVATEVVHITGRSGNNLTLVRAQDGTSSPASFADGATIENRMTAGTLTYIDPLAASFAGSIEIGPNSDTDATGAIAIGDGALSGDGIAGNASHKYQIAIGYLARTTWNGCIAIGNEAQADPTSSADTRAIAIGDKAQAIANSVIHIGTGNGTSTGITSADYGITIGAFNTNASIQSVLIGYSADLDSQSYQIGIGWNAFGSANSGIVIGRDAQVDSDFSMAFGYLARANESGVAIGYDSLSVGYTATALGRDVVNYHIGTFKSQPVVCPREDGNYSPAGQATHLYGNKATVTFPPMDLGVPQTWTTASTYMDQEVVVDPTPTGTEQHYLVIGSTATDIFADSFYVGINSLNQSTEGTEPTWAVTQGAKASATAANSQWVMIDPKSGVELDVTAFLGATIRYRFVPTRIGFYCYEITGTHTTKPAFNFGNETSDTAYLTAEAVDLITADNQMQWWDIGGNDAMVPAAENLKVTLTTSGDGNLFMGKFVVEGIVMALRG